MCVYAEFPITSNMSSVDSNGPSIVECRSKDQRVEVISVVVVEQNDFFKICQTNAASRPIAKCNCQGATRDVECVLTTTTGQDISGSQRRSWPVCRICSVYGVRARLIKYSIETCRKRERTRADVGIHGD